MFYDSLVVFPPQFNGIYKCSDHKTMVEYKLRFIKPPDKWDSLSKSIPIEDVLQDRRMVRGDICMATGFRNHITVLECDNLELLSKLKTVQIITGDSNLYIFNYESCLSNIHGVMNGINIINDGKFITFDYKSSIIDQDRKIISIPKEILMQLLDASRGYTYKEIDERKFELLMLLPNRWFNEMELLEKVIHVIRNEVLTDETRKATLTKIIVERSYSFNVKDVETFLSLPMTCKDRRYTFATLMKALDNETLDKIKKLQDERRKARRRQIPKKPVLEYDQEALSKLSDIKSIDSSLNVKKIIAMDSRFESFKINICKSCNRVYKKGCCPSYSRNNNTTAIFIKNARITS